MRDHSHDLEFEKMVEILCTHPGMFLCPASYGAVCAYLERFDAARNGGPLVGLHQWLVVRSNGGDNRVWQALVQELVGRKFINAVLSDEELPDKELPGEELFLREVGKLFAEFFEYRRVNGITKVFHEYARWLLRRSWYKGPLRRKRT